MVAQNQQLDQIVGEACCRTPELEIATDLPIRMRIHKLATGFHKVKEEATRIQLDLNLQIIELRLKIQPPTPPEVREQWHHAIQLGLEAIECAI